MMLALVGWNAIDEERPLAGLMLGVSSDPNVVSTGAGPASCHATLNAEGSGAGSGAGGFGLPGPPFGASGDTLRMRGHAARAFAYASRGSCAAGNARWRCHH